MQVVVGTWEPIIVSLVQMSGSDGVVLAAVVWAAAAGASGVLAQAQSSAAMTAGANLKYLITIFSIECPDRPRHGGVVGLSERPAPGAKAPPGQARPMFLSLFTGVDALIVPAATHFEYLVGAVTGRTADVWRTYGEKSPGFRQIPPRQPRITGKRDLRQSAHRKNRTGPRTEQATRVESARRHLPAPRHRKPDPGFSFSQV